MTKITPEHLARSASASRRPIKFSTITRAGAGSTPSPTAPGALGWAAVEVGFEKLLAAICEGRVGAVVSIEASKL